jgi:hypothetical protein
MNNVSMDALNRGWSIGFGTKLRYEHADFDHGPHRDAVPRTPRAERLTALFAKIASAAAGLATSAFGTETATR